MRIWDGRWQTRIRMTTWLYQLLEREKLTKFDLPEGFPLAMLYSTEPATAEQSN